MYRIAINGFGRIGRNILRAFYERPELHDNIQIVAINDPGNIEINAHLFQFDTVHGRFSQNVEISDNTLIINGNRIHYSSECNPAYLPWSDLEIDLVHECSGLFTHRNKASQHLLAGAKKVLISAPGTDADATVVYGINDNIINDSQRIISNASCTTNCLAPVVKPLHESLGILSGYMTSVHALTNDQQLSDAYHSDIYRARAGIQSIIPTKSGAAAAIGLVIPELMGKLDGLAVRVPTINVSLVDLTFNVERDTNIEEVNDIVREASESDLKAVLGYSNKPLVSVDYNHIPYSGIYDSLQTRVNGSLVKVMIWYDNEWGYSNRMLDTSIVISNASVSTVNSNAINDLKLNNVTKLKTNFVKA